jgi:hypothetical protein
LGYVNVCYEEGRCILFCLFLLDVIFELIKSLLSKKEEEENKGRG